MIVAPTLLGGTSLAMGGLRLYRNQPPRQGSIPVAIANHVGAFAVSRQGLGVERPGASLAVESTMRGIALLLVLTACAEEPVEDPQCSHQTTKEIPLISPRQVDLLVVLDRSPSMAARLDVIADSLAGLATNVSLHVALVTTDLVSEV